MRESGEGEIAMKKILDYPNGPVSLEGRWKDIKFKAWRGTRSKDISLTAQAARRLALALLLEAEKLEAKIVHGVGTTKRLGSYCGVVRHPDRTLRAVEYMLVGGNNKRGETVSHTLRAKP